jgi:transposase
MFFVGIDIAKVFSVCSVIDDKEEMIIKPFPFNSTSGGFKKLINNIVSLNCDTKDIIIGMEATGLLFCKCGFPSVMKIFIDTCQT